VDDRRDVSVRKGGPGVRRPHLRALILYWLAVLVGCSVGDAAGLKGPPTVDVGVIVYVLIVVGIYVGGMLPLPWAAESDGDDARRRTAWRLLGGVIIGVPVVYFGGEELPAGVIEAGAAAVVGITVGVGRFRGR